MLFCHFHRKEANIFKAGETLSNVARSTFPPYIVIFGIQLGEEKFDWKIAKALKSNQDSPISDEGEIRASCLEEEATREILQVCEDDIYKAAERIKLLIRTAPLQLPLFLQITLIERVFVSSLPFFSYDVSSQGELESGIPVAQKFWLDVHPYNDLIYWETTWSEMVS